MRWTRAARSDVRLVLVPAGRVARHALANLAYVQAAPAVAVGAHMMLHGYDMKHQPAAGVAGRAGVDAKRRPSRGYRPRRALAHMAVAVLEVRIVRPQLRPAEQVTLVVRKQRVGVVLIVLAELFGVSDNLFVVVSAMFVEAGVERPLALVGGLTRCIRSVGQSGRPGTSARRSVR